MFEQLPVQKADNKAKAFEDDEKRISMEEKRKQLEEEWGERADMYKII